MHRLYLPGETTPPLARPLAELPLLVLVGLTGAGKSSLLDTLSYPALPDRREVVDRFVLPLFGYQPGTKLDRAERFALTRRFREGHPGGVAEALFQSKAEPAWPLIFDGLRGEDELRYALEHLPQAHFIVLEASDLTRLKRLLSRGDSFDRVRLGATDLDALKALAEGVLSEAELEEALSWDVPPQDLTAKLKIVAEERKNYDPEGAKKVLYGSPRALFLDTERLSVEQEATRIRAFVGKISP
ncbi:MAG: hypothetical protein C4331_14715 [Meiothermus sp.]